jgi:hypothetical protein
MLVRQSLGGRGVVYTKLRELSDVLGLQRKVRILQRHTEREEEAST